MHPADPAAASDHESGSRPGPGPQPPDRERLRTTFEQDPDGYAAHRPGYPAAVLADLTGLAGLRPGARVLEIGCGTGQLTASLAAAGLDVTAVELGPGLAALARRRLDGWADARVVVGAFEDVTLPEAAYDLVVAATAFHWIDPAVRVTKPARLLRPGGALAVVETHHVAGGTVEFFRAVQDCYEAWDPATPPGLRLRPAAELSSGHPELDDAEGFAPAVTRRHEWELTYTTAGYLGLLLTYSNHRDLPAWRRDGLLAGIRTLIDERFGGTVTKRYCSELRVARRDVTGPAR